MNRSAFLYNIGLAFVFVHAQPHLKLEDILHPVPLYSVINSQQHPQRNSLSLELYDIATANDSCNALENPTETHERLKDILLRIIDHAPLKNERVPHKNVNFTTRSAVRDIAINPAGNTVAFCGLYNIDQYNVTTQLRSNFGLAIFVDSSLRAIAYHPQKPIIAALTCDNNKVYLIDAEKNKLTHKYVYEKELDEDDEDKYKSGAIRFNRSGTEILYAQSPKYGENIFSKMYVIKPDQTRQKFTLPEDKSFNFFTQDLRTNSYKVFTNPKEWDYLRFFLNLKGAASPRYIKPLNTSDAYVEVVLSKEDPHKIVFNFFNMEDELIKAIETPFDAEDFFENFKDIDVDVQHENIALHFKDKIVIYNAKLRSVIKTFNKKCRILKIAPQGDFLVTFAYEELAIDFIETDYKTALRDYFSQQQCSPEHIRQQLLALILVAHKKDTKPLRIKDLAFFGKQLDQQEIRQTLDTFPDIIKYHIRKTFF